MKQLIELVERRPSQRVCKPGTVAMDSDTAQALADDLQILGHPIRLQLLDLLAKSEGQVCVCDLESAVSVKQPTVSHHLRLLREAGLIDCEKHGLWAYYYIKTEAMAALRARIARQLAAFA